MGGGGRVGRWGGELRQGALVQGADGRSVMEGYSKWTGLHRRHRDAVEPRAARGPTGRRGHRNICALAHGPRNSVLRGGTPCGFSPERAWAQVM